MNISKTTGTGGDKMTKKEIVANIRKNMAIADFSNELDRAYISAKIFSAVAWEVIDSNEGDKLLEEYIKLCEEANKAATRP